MTRQLTPEEINDLRSGCDDYVTFYNGSANVEPANVLKALAYIAELEAHAAHLLTEHADDCAGLIRQIKLRDKELFKAEADKQARELTYAEETRPLIMRADSADWAAAELRVENYELRTSIKWALIKLQNHAHQDCLDIISIEDAASSLNITLPPNPYVD